MRKPQAGSLADERKQMWLSEIDGFGMMMTVIVDGAWNMINPAGVAILILLSFEMT